MVSWKEGMEIYKRRAGNSTRQIDYTIQLLFLGYVVLVQDHSGVLGATQDLFKRILRRLEIEHGIEPDDVVLNRDKFELFIQKK